MYHTESLWGRDPIPLWRPLSFGKEVLIRGSLTRYQVELFSVGDYYHNPIRVIIIMTNICVPWWVQYSPNPPSPTPSTDECQFCHSSLIFVGATQYQLGPGPDELITAGMPRLANTNEGHFHVWKCLYQIHVVIIGVIVYIISDY